ncbi:RNA 2',3'-cyclic phosphodiesterase [Desulfotruncus alcoholivorax]|uniref:RNA 2',3'-cyclic phosphodiesterase n=1 Tax=Desulfotruncus alcoholivorax TaxID=265477 RepID=UPI000407251B|nr:RNA 2',3'-cyclic phosphodiesterase [Desulfotruncus alcoholivorax]
MEQKRLFWAICLPENIKRKLFGLQSKLREVPADVKWVEQHNFHLTLKFLGDTRASQVRELTNAVSHSISGTGAFSLELAGIGFFPGPKRPKVIWAGVRGEVEKFKQLHEKVEEAVARLGFTDHSNRFSPHLTLGRTRSLRGSAELVDRAALIAKDLEIIGKIRVDSISLIESQLTRKGPIYTTLVSLGL